MWLKIKKFLGVRLLIFQEEMLRLFMFRGADLRPTYPKISYFTRGGGGGGAGYLRIKPVNDRW